MQTSITIDGKKYKAVINGKTHKIYRRTFHEDSLKVFETSQMSVVKAIRDAQKNNIEYNPLDLIINNTSEETIQKLTWAALKRADESIPGFEEFTDNIDNYVEWIVNCAFIFDNYWQTIYPIEPDESKKKDTENAVK